MRLEEDMDKILYVLGLAALFFLAWEDMRTRKINGIAAAGVWALTVLLKIFFTSDYKDIFICVCCGAVFIIISWFSRSFGMGDALAIGMVFGCLNFTSGIQVVMMSFIFISTAALVLLVLKRAGRKTPMPYVPWLMAAYIAGGLLQW